MPSAHGLQRLTNFNGQYITVNKQLVPVMPSFFNVPRIFVSPEDLVWQEATNNNYPVAFSNFTNPSGVASPVGTPSPVVPDLSITRTTNANGNLVPTYQPSADWRYTFGCLPRIPGPTPHSGQMLSNSSLFEGSIVIFESRPFAIRGIPASI